MLFAAARSPSRLRLFGARDAVEPGLPAILEDDSTGLLILETYSRTEMARASRILREARAEDDLRTWAPAQLFHGRRAAGRST